MKLTKVILALLLITTTVFANSEAILKLDTKGHTALIGDIIVSKSGDIISASNDKTIRVWDKNGDEKRKILGQIGSGSEGKIFAIALSSDEQYLAVGGFILGSGSDGSRAGAIRIYHYPTGKLTHILKSHTNVVFDLAFSDDGNKSDYLISGSGDFSAKIWSTKDWNLLETITTHSNDVYGVKIIQKNNHYFAVTAGYDNKISLYDINRKTTLKTDTLNHKLKYLAINDTHIAVSGSSNDIDIYDHSLTHLKTIKNDTKASGLAYSKDGEYLIVGSGSYPYPINIYQTNRYQKISTFDKHTNTTMAVNFIDKNRAVSGGGNNNEIYIWDIDSGKTLKKIEGVGDTVWSVGISGDKITWGNIDDCSGKNCSKFEKSINLNDFQISPLKTQNFNRISTTNGSYSLSHRAGGDYGYSDAVLDIKKGGTTLASITKSSTDGYRHRCYGWWGEYIISGGSSGQLKVYNKSGNEVASLIGHTSEVWSIAIDGDRLVSGSDDQTIMVWGLSQIGKKEQIYPMLNLFISKDDEYIVWSKSGYFTSSVGGDKYVGYHINQGADKEARYVGSDKYFDTYYRPDIIANILKTGSEKKAIAYANQTKRVKTVDITTSLPPIISLLSSSNIDTSSNSTTIKYTIDSKQPIEKLIITNNGVQIDTRALYKKLDKNIQTLTIDLNDGENIISLRAKNKYAISDEVIVNAYKKSSQKNIYKPTLYLLSIGVSRYKNSEYNLKVAHKDALAITKLFKKQKGKIYKDVVVKTLTNQEATTDNILDGLDWIDKEVTSKDIAIIFIAGHGINDESGDYYFLPYETNLDRIRRTALPWYEVQKTISNLPSKTILLADTCHSGNITGNRRDITGALKSIINSGTGSIIMTATTGNGYSYEQSNWGHGAFTKSIIEGISQLKADYDNDKTISIKEIDLYITNRVKKLTNGKQKPTTIIPKSIPDFAIGVK
jgi:WD40 repeat protein